MEDVDCRVMEEIMLRIEMISFARIHFNMRLTEIFFAKVEGYN